MRHMDDGRLQAWIDESKGALDQAERTAVERHLSVCPVCTAKVDALRTSTDDAKDLLLQLSEPEEIPDFSVVRERAGALAAGGPESDRDSRVPDRRNTWSAGQRVGWAASILIALGAGWMANELTRSPERLLDDGGSANQEIPAVGGEPDGQQGLGMEEAGPRPGPAAEVAPPEVSIEPQRAEPAPTPGPEEPSSDEATQASEPVREPPPARTIVLRGRVTDAESGQPLAGAQVFVPGTGQGTLTGANGAYSIAFQPAPATTADDMLLNVQLIGYAEESRPLLLGDSRGAVSDFQLSQIAIALDEIVVTGAAREPVRRSLGNAVSMIEPAAEAGLAVAALLSDAVTWNDVSMEQAADSLGSAPPQVGGLGVINVHASRVDNYPVVRVLHALADGETFALYLATQPFIVADADEAGLFARKVEPELFALGRARISSDSISSLLQRLR